MSELLDEKFKNVKKTPGVQIWRIEKLEMKEDFYFLIWAIWPYASTHKF